MEYTTQDVKRKALEMVKPWLDAKPFSGPTEEVETKVDGKRVTIDLPTSHFDRISAPQNINLLASNRSSVEETVASIIKSNTEYRNLCLSGHINDPEHAFEKAVIDEINEIVTAQKAPKTYTGKVSRIFYNI